ncbi:MAG: excalibur calcium-binding domain-containing protein [Psychrobacillus psychrodurans]
MNKKLGQWVVVLVLVISFVFMNGTSMEAASKVMWGKTELKLGQIGKATVLEDASLVKLEGNGSLSTIRKLKKGEEYRVYSFKGAQSGLYGVGGGAYIQKGDKIKYETPSKSKLALLENVQKSPDSQKPSQTESGLEIVVGAPTKFQNCKELNKVYPQGVKKGHPAYAPKHDRDKDNWACER